MRFLITLAVFLVGSLAQANDDTAPGYYLYRARVEAKASSLQVDITLASIEKHLSGVPADKEICFDIGNLFVYLKELDLAVDLASEDLKNEPWETRYYFRLPFRARDNLLGACGVVGDPTMPVGDFQELKKRLLTLNEILRLLY